MTCPRCLGAGYHLRRHTWTDRDCRRCDGTGQIRPKPAPTQEPRK